MGIKIYSNSISGSILEYKLKNSNLKIRIFLFLKQEDNSAFL